MITIARGDELGEQHRHRVAEVFTSGFAEDFRAFSKDPSILAEAFAHMLLLEHFHVASVEGTPAGVATFTTGAEQVFAPDKRVLRQHLGLLRGTICFRVIRSNFMRPSAGALSGAADIGFVATAPECRGHGVGTALLKHLISLPGHQAFVLEDIKNTNEAALGLYRKHGFTEYSRRRQRFSRFAGFDHLVTVRREAE